MIATFNFDNPSINLLTFLQKMLLSNSYSTSKIALTVAHPSESTPLVINTASEDSSSPLQQKSACCISRPPFKHLCLPSKAAILILLWTIIVGAMYYIFVGFAAVLEIGRSQINTNFSVYDSLPYAIFATVMMFYPLSGFIADVCCGRLKTVVISLIILLFCLIILLITVLLTEEIHSNFDHPLSNNRDILVVILAILSLFTFIIGLVGYQANFIQLGLDQLRASIWVSLFTMLSGHSSQDC